MTTYAYSFSKTNDFPYGKVDSDRLRDAILKAPISKPLDSINSAGDTYSIEFTEALSNSSGTWKGVWETGTTYYADDVVYHLGVSYTALSEHSSQEPPNGTYWSVLTGEFAALIYVVRQHSGEPLPTSNVVEVQTVLGENLPVSGLGTGGWFPSPDENPITPNQAEVAGLLHDGDGNTRFRGVLLTDEGAFRTDFCSQLEEDLTGTVTFTKDSVNIDGSGSSFYDEINRDYYLRLSTDAKENAVKVGRIDSNTGLVLEIPYPGSTGSGTAVASKWVLTETGNGALSADNSCVKLQPGTVSGDNCGIHRDGDYLPMQLFFTASISQRVVNQKAVIGFSDIVWGSEYDDLACIEFEGTDNTKITFLTSFGGQTQESEVQLVFGLNTSQLLSYLIEVSATKVSLFIGDENGSDPVLVASHHKHVPGPYTVMFYGAAIWNTGTVESATTLAIDSIYYGSNNTINMSNSSKGDSIAVKTAADSIVTAYIKKQEGPKNTFVSPNWCDKTSWYSGSIYVADEVAEDLGSHTSYQLDHTYVIDSYHGKFTFEDYEVDSESRSYRVIVKVNDVAKTEQDPHLGTGGDYSINYATGTITFLSALQADDVVKATYHYASTSLFLVAPITGKNLIVDSVEVQCSEDVILNDSFNFQAYGYVDAFAPQMMGPPWNIPSGTKIPLRNPLIYKTLRDIINDSNKSYPAYPAFGGSNWRSLPKACYIFTWDYPVGSTVLQSLYGMELRITLQHDVPCGGAFTTATLYATSEDT